MSPAEVVAQLSTMGVAVACPSPERIRLTVEFGAVPAEAVTLAQAHKPALVDYLRPVCRPHNSPANYIDSPAPNRPGWIRSTCRVCGKFVGYRPTSTTSDNRFGSQ